MTDRFVRKHPTTCHTCGQLVPIDFGSMLGTRMSALKMSQAELARMLGMHQPDISRSISGERQFPEKRFSDLMKALGVTGKSLRVFAEAYAKSILPEAVAKSMGL